ncbi:MULTISPECIES: YkvS family protein [Salimicrobium]|uniref:DUF2187 domain-containing protein n=1 Tax=Salimicrobium humidisoli TaxID=2029857 RepID=A0ABX4HTZ2_9BACI|nr:MULTISPECIES: DUF2187 family protein [Salimicrobium]PBB06543.1 hypothetical protein CKW00_02525 [Salimicrobium humidisoli]
MQKQDLPIEEIDKAVPGDIVAFERGNETWKGKVIPSGCTNSVVVDLSIMEELPDRDVDSHLTCINHRKYTILSRESQT